MTRLSPTPILRGIAALSLFLIWLLPFVLRDHKVPVGTFWQEWTAAALLIGAICIGLLSQRAPLPLRLPRAVLVFAALAAVISLQWMLGLLNFTATGFVPLSYLGLAMLACVLGANLRSDAETAPPWINGIALAVIIGGVFTVYAQLSQLLGLDQVQPFISPLPAGQRPFGNINQINHTATYLGLALSAVVYLRSTAQLNRFSTAMLVLILCGGLALTGQRSALAYAALPLLLTLLTWRRLPSGQRSAVLTSAAVLLVFLLFNGLLPLINHGHSINSTLEKFATSPLFNARWNYWEHTWLMLQAQPWLGVGFDQFWPAYFAQLDVLGGSEAPNNPHNLLAALLSETGLIGTLLVSVPLLLWLWRQRGGTLSWTHWLGLSQIAMIGFHSFVEYPLWYAYFLVIAAFWLGATDRASWAFTLRQPRWLGVALALLLVPLLVNVGLRYQQLRTQVWAMPHPGILGLAHFQPKPTTTYAALTALGESGYFQREALFWQPDLHAIDPTQLAADIARTERAMRVAPSSSLLYRLCVLRVLNGQTEQALALLRHARMIFPERYQQMQEAFPAAAQRWPAQFGAVLPRLSAP